MEPYLFHGVVLPERAQLTLQFSIGFEHVVSGISAEARISIILNQVAVWVTSAHDWDIFDLRNVVRNLVQGHLAMVGYIKGYAYEFEISRILNIEKGIDQVFGIDIPCISKRNEAVDLDAALLKLREKSIGQHGLFVTRCLSDLTSAMKHADDTGFYCYRAIESLRHHCAATFGLSDAEKSKQWEKFREVAKCDETKIRLIKSAADPVRHGNVYGVTSADRNDLFMSTWDIVDGYLSNS